MSNISPDRYVSNLVGNGSIVNGATILSSNLNTPGTPARSRNFVVAQKNMNLKSSEASHILEKATNNTLHLDYIIIGQTQYIITSIQERSYYGRNTNTEVGGGIIVCKTAKSVLVATYPGSVSHEAIPLVEHFADSIPQ
ncbi:hypothetical protein PROFUN_06441 [Planoprotostelium fungivorum]|uniref:Profilin n=1 Tax=Planoprotostelium fungivorum TaxID=1890364 RepID=A0A2P6MR21_9EUKA|nr:hypothetical protein PROFUN_06441 [Planoprotostelium fungivorum]